MNLSRLAPVVLLAVGPALAIPAAARADQDHDHDHVHAVSEKLGTISFPISCKPETKVPFERGVALLHSFAYEPAAAAFRDLAAQDPECAMAQWGLAMSQFHPIWAAPVTAELEAGKAAVARARELGGATPREQAYIDAIGAFYRDADSLDHRTRVRAFEQAMGKVAAAHPDDDEAAIFHALGLLGIAYNSPPDKTYALQKQAAETLNRLLPEHPDHPGIAHYMIHSFDYPELAELALPAARAYAKIAPAAAHALHMPSHIFVRLGLWDEAIASNLDSEATARRQAAASKPGATAYNALHAIDYLAYAYLQTAQDGKVRELAEQAAKVTALDEPNFAGGYALVAVPARWALERRQWEEAATLPAPPAVFPWEKYPYTTATTEFARAVGAARAGKVDLARQAVEKLGALQKSLAAGSKGGFDWATQVEIQRLAAAGWLAHAEDKDAEARQLLRAAADLEDTTDKHPVTPGSILPAREMLGDLELELGDGAAALAAYEASLRTAPARFRSLYGAAQAAEKAGQAEKAKEYYGKVVALAGGGDASRPELARARAASTK